MESRDGVQDQEIAPDPSLRREWGLGTRLLMNVTPLTDSILGHLKKIISFSSSWLRNLNAAGGNLILSIYCASYINYVDYIDLIT